MPLTITHIKSTYSRSPLFKAACIIGALLILLSGAEVWYQVRVNNLKSVVDKVGQSIIKPMGGVEEGSGVEGEHVWNICVDNGPCPGASTTWLFLVDTDKENLFMHQSLQYLQSNGYYVSSTEASRFGGAGIEDVTLKFEISSLAGTTSTPPYAAPVGKEWASMSISAYYNVQ